MSSTFDRRMTATGTNSAVTIPFILLLFDSQRFEHCIFRAVIEDEIETASFLLKGCPS